MNISILTLFPELFEPFLRLGMVGRALEKELITCEVDHLRDFAINTQGQVDDTPYGGGSGMLLRPESAAAALDKAKSRFPDAKVVLLSPRGKLFSQELARELADCAGKAEASNEPSSCQNPGSPGDLIFLCCRYEGIDQRVIEDFVDIELSIGDFVLMGGECAAMAVIESVVRLLPGVLGNPESTSEESFSEPLLEYPQYTKPREFRGKNVPEVLLSGDHARIAQWRKEQSEKLTSRARPLVYAKYLRENPDRVEFSEVAQRVSVALVHFPVLNKEGKIITSSVTNLDLHDISRSCRSYGVPSFYISHPTKVIRKLFGRILEHWSEGYGYHYNPNRSDALGVARIVPDFDEAVRALEAQNGRLPKIVVTSAKKYPNSISYPSFREHLAASDDHYLIVFGTGWGLADALIERADLRLEPILGPSDFNHLSVRAAAAITLDRLLGI